MSVIRIRDVSSLLACCGALAMFSAASWSAEPLSVRKLPVDEMRFPDQKLGEKFLRMDAVCNSFAKPNWHRRPFQTFDSFQARGVYFSEWASFAEKGRNPVNYRGSNEMHCVAMSAYFNADSPAPTTHDSIVGLGINAVWNPPETGWRAAVDYYTMHGAIYPRSGRQSRAVKSAGITVGHRDRSPDQDSGGRNQEHSLIPGVSHLEANQERRVISPRFI